MTTTQTPAAVARPPGRSLRAVVTSPRLAPPLSIVVFVAAWQVLQPVLPTRQLPAPLAVGRFVLDELRGDTISPYTVYEAFGLSLARLGLGLVIAFVLGTVAGILMGMSSHVEAFLHDPVIGALTMPHLVFALLFAMWLGFGFWTPVVTVVLASIPFVVTNVAEGVRNVPRQLLDMGRAYDLGPWRILRNVTVPSLTPFLLAAARYAVSLGWKALAIAELFGASDGAGWVLRYWYDAHRVTSLIGYALFFVFLALVLDLVLFKWLSGRLFRWQAGARVRPAG